MRFNRNDGEVIEEPEDMQVFFTISGFISKKHGLVGINYEVKAELLRGQEPKLARHGTALAHQVFSALEKDGLIYLDEIFKKDKEL